MTDPRPAPDPQPTPDPQPDPQPDPHADDDLAGLDDRSRQLVERANAEAAQRRRELRAAERDRDAAQRELTEYRQAQESDQERLVREAEERGRTAAAGEYERRLAAADVVSEASGRLRDPRDAIAHLDIAGIAEVSDTDQRQRVIREAVDGLLESKPYLAVERDNGRTGGTLVTPGGRSQPPGGGGPATPDSWIRDQARKR